MFIYELEVIHLKLMMAASQYSLINKSDKFAFVEAVARKNYGLKQAYANGKAASTVAPFFGIRCAG